MNSSLQSNFKLLLNQVTKVTHQLISEQGQREEQLGYCEG